jgi:hypothetical protein
MTDYAAIVAKYQDQLAKALDRFEYSYRKIQNLKTDPELLDDEAMETWESFSSRFSRVVDLFLSKYARAKVLENDPGFHGTLRDHANQAEKLGLLDQASEWMALRELRNIEAHTYEEDLERFLEQLRAASPRVLKLRGMLQLQVSQQSGSQSGERGP